MAACGGIDAPMDALSQRGIFGLILLRWATSSFGIIWLGHLYFFNLVNVPFQGGLDKELKPKVNPALLLRAFWWFRWGAMYTFLFGLLLFFWHYLAPEANFNRRRRAASPVARCGSCSACCSARSCGSTSGS